jgi:hypothetical protein
MRIGDCTTGGKPDLQQQSGITNVDAAGDVAESYELLREGNFLNPVWLNAVAQGKAVGANMEGRCLTYEGWVVNT